mmetsp:Transcript_7769/g.19998  ORF Transcript_7769/g.19998 Transcript_7769/m.19998 type:complete len:97 (+) Transcript_7769:313-603(+)
MPVDSSQIYHDNGFRRLAECVNLSEMQRSPQTPWVKLFHGIKQAVDVGLISPDVWGDAEGGPADADVNVAVAKAGGEALQLGRVYIRGEAAADHVR